MRAKGTGGVTEAGYLRLKSKKKSKMAHVLIAEAALGKPLRAGVVVHHVNENRLDNRAENLVICTVTYHNFLHQRMRALAACGNADWRKCRICKFYDDPQKLVINVSKGRSDVFHSTCRIAYERYRRTGEFAVPVNPLPDNKRKCSYCQTYDDPRSMRCASYVRGGFGEKRDTYYHVVCRSAYSRELRSKKRSA